MVFTLNTNIENLIEHFGKPIKLPFWTLEFFDNQNIK